MANEEQEKSVPAEVGPPDFDPVIRPVIGALREWFPKSNRLAHEQLAFAVVHRVLQVEPVEGDLWLANAWFDPSGAPPDQAALIDQIYLLVRAWFPDYPAPVCLEVAGALIQDVLALEHVLEEIWAIRLSDPNGPAPEQVR